MPVLYSFRRCPYAMRARLALASSLQVCELREVVLARKPIDLLQASPKGTVPVLVLDDGSVLEQSLDIMRWALQTRDPEHWLPASPPQWETTEALIHHNDGPFKQQLDRYKYPARHGLQNGVEERDKAIPWLLHLNSLLTEHRHLAGARFGLSDAALAPFVRQFAHTQADWFYAQPWNALIDWLQAFEQSPRYHNIMDKYPAWIHGQPACWFPVNAPDDYK